MFSCIGDVGNPPGHIDIYSDIPGEFGLFLTSANVNEKSVYGFIKRANLARSTSNCSYTQEVYFALTNVTMKMHRKHLQCVLIPHRNLANGSSLTSPAQEIKVVPGTKLEISIK